MSDDRIVSLSARRAAKAAPISGKVMFGNDQLRLPFMKVEHAPRWSVTAQADLDGESPATIEASLVGYALDEDCPMGWVDRNDRGLSAEFMVGPDHADMIQLLAVSPVAFEIQIVFSADQDGAVRSLRLTANRKQEA